MGSNLDCEGLGRFATAPQSSGIMPPKQYHVQRTVVPVDIVSRRISGAGTIGHTTQFSSEGVAEGRGPEGRFHDWTRLTCSHPAAVTQTPVEIGRANILDQRRRSRVSQI